MVKIVEKELEEYIYSQEMNGGPYFLPADENFDFVYRQFKLHPYGIIDLLYVDCNFHDDIRLHIVELKKDKLDTDALLQISRYRQGIKHHISLLFPDPKNRPNVQVTGSLIGTSLGDGMWYLIDSIPWLDCHTYKLSLESGVTFEQQCRQGDEPHWRLKGVNPNTLKNFYAFLMKKWAISRRDFKNWKKQWEEQKNKSNVVEFKK